MFLMVVRALWKFASIDRYIRRQDFAGIGQQIRCCSKRGTAGQVASLEAICRAVDIASALYWKEVLCLQRSAATACLLKEHGYAAQVVVGAQQAPFRAHAWVEVDGRVVNDKPYMLEIYDTLERI